MRGVDAQDEDGEPKEWSTNRMLGFRGTPDERMSKLELAPNVGSEILLVQSSRPNAALGKVLTSYASVEGKIIPIDQSIEIYINSDFFENIHALRETKLHLRIRCIKILVNETDYKEEIVGSFRVSLLPSDGSSEPARAGLLAKLFS